MADILQSPETFHLIRRGVVYELRSEPQGGFFITLPALPGCTSFGETIEQALDMIQEARDLWIEVAREDGYPIPSQFDVQEALPGRGKRVPTSAKATTVAGKKARFATARAKHGGRGNS